MSTTIKRDVAISYASTSNIPVVFQMQMGMIDRGAELTWLSQYPHEEEILFAPLTGLEVQGTSVSDDILVVDVRVSINLQALTIEQVVSKMQTSHLQLITMLEDEFKYGGAPARALAPLESLMIDAKALQPTWFNVPQHFKNATEDALDAQERVVKLLAEEKTWVTVGSNGASGVSTPGKEGPGQAEGRLGGRRSPAATRAFSDSRRTWLVRTACARMGHHRSGQAAHNVNRTLFA